MSILAHFVPLDDISKFGSKFHLDLSIVLVGGYGCMAEEVC